MASRRVFWSVTPEQTTSPYITELAGSIRSLGVRVEPVNARILARSSGEVVHVQWPEHLSGGTGTFRSIAKGVRSIGLLGICRLRHHKLVLTAHNLEPHLPTGPIDRYFRRRVETLAERITVMAPGQIDELRASGVDVRAKAALIRHPMMNADRLQTTADEPPGPDAPLVLLGLIASYHMPAEFIEALAATGSSRRVIVVGAVGEQRTLDRLEALAATHPWLEVRPGYLPNEQLDELLREATAIVALQRHPFNTGAPFFALPRGIPVVLSESALVADLRSTVGEEWVYGIERELGDLDIHGLQRFLERERSSPDLEAHRVALIAEQHLALYETLAGWGPAELTDQPTA